MARFCEFQHMYDYHYVKWDLMQWACINTRICLHIHVKMDQFSLNPIAHSKAKIVCNFGLSECNRVKIPKDSWLYLGNGHYGQIIIIIGFLINVQVQGQYPQQWVPFQVTGLLHAWQTRSPGVSPDSQGICTLLLGAVPCSVTKTIY